MESNIIFLLLGLAFVLTTTSSLLATSGSGREEQGGNPTVHHLDEGEISGSISLTSKGELWLTVFLDTYSILIEVEVINTTNEQPVYKCTIVSIAELVTTPESSKSPKPIETSESPESQKATVPPKHPKPQQPLKPTEPSELAEQTAYAEFPKTNVSLETNPEIVCSSAEDATSQLFALIEKIHLHISEASKRSLPFAISSGWRSPEECRQFIKHQMKKHEEKEQ